MYRRADSTAYDTQGRVFRHPNGLCSTLRGSSVDITFPSRPTREYVEVREDGTPITT